MFLFRWLFVVAAVWALGWVATNVPVGGRTVWQRITGEAAYVEDMADGVGKRLGNPDEFERLGASDRKELRERVRESVK
ncbi:MAG: hypothetical protein AABZ30_00475 [Myxococcota bacterium]